MDGIVCTNAHPRYARKLDDPHGGDTTIRMEQVKEVIMANHDIEDESSWIWLTSERMGFLLRSEFASENQGESGSSEQCNDQRTDQTAFFWCLSSQIAFETPKGNSMMSSSKMHLKCSWVLDQNLPSHPTGGSVRILEELLLWEKRLGKTTKRLQRASLHAWSRTEGGRSRAAVRFLNKSDGWTESKS